MRNPRSWPESGPVSEPVTTVSINGVERAVEAVTVTRAVPQVLDQQVVGAGGINAASGSVTVAPTSDVQSVVATPWGGSVAKPGESVVVESGFAESRVRLFTGLIDSSAGTFADASLSTDVVDATDRLNRSVAFDALHTTMPPLVDGEFIWRQIGLCSTYFTDHVLRQCGFFATPPQESGCVLSAPMMGSTMPERGTVTASRRYGGTHEEGPAFGGMPTGVGLWDVTASWRPSDYEKSPRWNIFQITLGVGDLASGGWTKAGMRWANGDSVHMSISSARRVKVETVVSGVRKEWLYSDVQLTAWRMVTLRFGPVDGSFSLRFDTGSVQRGTMGAAAPDSWAAKNWEGFVESPSWYVNAFQVSFPGVNEFEAVTSRPSAVLTPPTSAAGPAIPELLASPAIPPTPAIDLLKQQAEAELAAMWIDEDGVFQWRNRERLTNQPVRAAYTSKDSLMDVAWKLDSQSTRRKVTVKYRQPASRRSYRYAVLAWQGGSTELRAGDTYGEFVEPDADEDWIDVDTSIIELNFTRVDEFNRGRGSWQGWQNLDQAGNPTSVTGVENTTSFTKVTAGRWVYRAKIKALPAGVDRIKLGTDEGDLTLASQYRGVGLPIIRCKAKIKWADVTAQATPTGPAWAQDLEHDASWWVQSSAEAQKLADEVGAQLVKTNPQVESVTLVGDPRLQLGDKIRVEDQDVTGLCIVGTVSEISHDIKPGDHSMTVKLIVTDVGAPLTLGEFDQQNTGSTLQQLDTAWVDKSLATFDQESTGPCAIPLNPGPQTASSPPTLADIDARWSTAALAAYDTGWSAKSLKDLDDDPLR